MCVSTPRLLISSSYSVMRVIGTPYDWLESSTTFVWQLQSVSMHYKNQPIAV